MVQYQAAKASDHLDGVFAALSSPARRAALDALGQGARTVSDLAAPHGMSLTGFMKHVRVLQSAGLITCVKEGRTVTCELAAEPFEAVASWLASRERMWSRRLDALGRHLDDVAKASTRQRRRAKSSK